MMALLPDKAQPIRDAVFAAYEADRNDEFRDHLGASIIGQECERALWYGFRWASKTDFPGRVLRLFETGNLEEDRLVRNLRRIGATVLDRDPETGRQWRVEAPAEYGGRHFGGSLDGLAHNLPEAPKTWHVVEFKTHSAKSFRQLSKGVKTAKPQHWAQMQVYMHLMRLTRALYMAVCKDTDDLYTERVKYDCEAAEALLKRAKRVIEGDRPPAKLSEDPDYYLCRFCDHQELCHGDGFAPRHCRSCLHSTAVEEGKWHCAKWDKHLSSAEQRAGCKEHRYIPDLVPGELETVDGDRLVYRRSDESLFVDGGLKPGETVKRGTCKNCGSASQTVHAGKGPHAAELRCRDCERHMGWLAKAEVGGET
ncbi:MAG: hypothetical protein PsegKO_34830 [Pseudohongiellaceae bacterium]